MGAQQITLHVGGEEFLECRLEILRGNPIQAREVIEHGGVADEGVELAKRLQGRRHRALVVLIPRHIPLNGDDRVAEGVSQRGQLRRIAAHHRDVRALGHVSTDDGAADPAGATGDQGHLPF